MKCPIDVDTDLVMTERQGVEIDYCPKCRGVWLDRGELDKILERSRQDAAPAAPAPAPAPMAPREPSPYPGREHERYDQRHHEHDKYDQYGKKRRKKSFFEELFD